MLAIVDVAVAGSQPIASRAHTVRMVAIFLVLEPGAGATFRFTSR
jgi:hypothetical protein